MSVRDSDRRNLSNSDQSRRRQKSDRSPSISRPGASDSSNQESFDRLAQLASDALAFPIVLLAFFDKDRIWIKSSVGVQATELDLDEWPFLEKLAYEPSLVVPNMAAARTTGKLLAAGKERECQSADLFGARSCAAAAIYTMDGCLIGALCVLDRESRVFSKAQIRTLRGIGDLIEQELARSPAPSDPKRAAPVSVRPAEPGMDRLIYVTRATQSASDAILVTDASTGARYANQSFVNMLGYTAEEISEMGGFAKLYVDKDASLDGLNDVTTGKHWSREMLVRTKTGAEIDVSIRLDPICDDYGNVVGRVTVITDITERQRAQKALQESEARLSSLIHSLDDIVFEFDGDGRMLNIWTQDESLLMVPSEQAVGHLVSEFMGEEAGENYARVFRNVMETGRPEQFEYELDVVAGSCWFMGRVTPIYSGDGQCRSVCMLARNITEKKNADKELAEAERKYRSIFENAVEGIFQSTEDGHLLSVNPALAGIYGYETPEQMIAEVNDIGTQIYVDPKRRGEALEIIQRQGYVSNLESETRRRDGSIVWISENVRTVRDPAGRLLYYEGTIQNITERKRAERELSEAEKKYRGIFENAIEGIFQATPEGRLLSVNPAFAQIHGFDSPEQMIELVTDTPNQLFAEPDEFWKSIAVIESQGHIEHSELEVLRRDGTRIWISAYARRVSDKDGKVLCLEGTIQDITERRRIRMELKEQQKFLRNIVDTDPNLIFVKDRDGKFVMVNRATAEVYGTTVDGLIGKSDADFNPNREEIEWFRRDDCAVMDTLNERFIPEEKVSDANGSYRWLQTVKRPLVGPDGKSDQVLGIATDITARKQAEDALKGNEERFRLLIENASDVIMLLDADGTVRYGSQSVERVLGYRVDEIIGRKIFDFTHPDDLSGDDCALLRGESAPGELRAINIRLRHKNGSWRFIESIGSNQIGTQGVEGIVLNSRDVTERRMAEKELDFLAYHDILTQLPNRLLFMDHLSAALKTARRGKRPVAVLFLDLDRFKMINDTLGHSLGDKLLRAVAKRLRIAVRENDIVSRWGGDEFTILLTEIADTQEAVRMAQRIIASLSVPFTLMDLKAQQWETFSSASESQYYITATVGISIYPSCGEDAETLIRNADTAMYRAKELGKNYYQLYSPSMNVGATQKLALEQSLRRAIEREEFMLHFQPQFDAVDNEIVGVEALLRWQHPEKGLIPPADFIPLAEETGLIVPLGAWVLRTACHQAVEWERAGYKPLRIAVNLSAHQFRRADLIPTIAEVLKETGLEACRLELELTESVLIESVQQNIETLTELASMGIRLAIDDFGTGYSSFMYLKRYPITCIKIDQAFVRDVTVDQNDAAITQSVIAMAKNLKMGVVAEGVETEQQCSFLREQGCRLMQGYYFSAPLPADALASLLEKRSVPIFKAA